MTPLDAYYTALDAGDVEATLACFTDDAVYVRPALDAPGLEFVRGRAELRAFFAARGKRDHRHYVRACAVEGRRCFVEGVAGVEGTKPTHVFLVHATVEQDGRLSRYLALMAEAPDHWQSSS
jgi:ketosteroid isomerase-like protein